jgi:putative transposase
MAQRRGEVPAGTYHVVTRSCGPIPIFLDDDDRTWFCTYLLRAMKAQGWICRAFCLMTTHYHLLLEVRENTLQRGMQRLNGCYARRFNARHERKGHLFGERYYSDAIESDDHMLAVHRYIARNPVKAGLVETPEDWRWASYRGCAGIDAGFPFVDPTPLRRYFSSDDKRACDLLRAFVAGVAHVS